jgi:two-component system, chemotaxis family, CheB/CheR fusion protein
MADKPKAVRKSAKAPRGGTRASSRESARPGASGRGAAFCVVGVGASAGGFDAIGELLGAMPSDSGLALVVIQHLSPNQRSLSAELFGRRTRMEVVEARHGDRLRANCVYTIPADVYASLREGVMQFEVPPDPRGRRLPIDHFFRSLGEDQEERAIGVVLSGSGSDGTLGLRHIVAHGGMVLVQTPEGAQFDGMPRSAIATGLVAHVLDPAEMPEAIVGYARHPYAARLGESAQAAEAELAALRAVFDVMRKQRGFSFEGYRHNTLLRRIHRRMGLRRIERMADYVSVLQSDPVEVNSLFNDMLIGVTEFFRDPEAWKLLDSEVIRPLVARKETGEAIRVWVPAASTGEEAYSLAMALLDERRRSRRNGPVQVFATDTNGEAVEVARAGLYPAGIAAHIPAARLGRYFTEMKDSHKFQVTRELRDCVVFGVQNVLTDPPFTKLDLVSCRNLLIYLGPELQKRLIRNFHFALRPGGYLFLGSAETVAQREQLFKPVSGKWRIFQRLGTTSREQVDFGRPAQPSRAMAEAPHGALVPVRPMSPASIAQTMILERFAPASVLVNGRREVLYYAGPTERYLRQPRGAPSNELLTLARDGLRATLNAALRRSARSDASVVELGGNVKRTGGYEPVKITVTPVAGTGADDDGRLVLVVFQDEPRPALRRARGKAAAPPLVRQLEEELRATRDDLQATIDRLEGANEALRASHEEVVAGNEELQSMNEELESSKEELQSLNEELNAVNQQLQTKIGEVEIANNDLTNLLESSDVATACLDRNLRIKWFTPAAREVLKVIATDVGRPMSDLASALAGDSLLRDARSVLERLAPVETEVRSEEGRSYLRRTMPYRTAEHKIDGVIVNFSDITETRRLAASTLEASEVRGKALEDRVAVADVQLRALAAELGLAEEREREAIARDLHDNLAQVLHVAKLKVGALAKAPGNGGALMALKELDTLMTHAEASVRSLMFQLNPPVLSELGLVSALQWLAEEMQRTYGLAVDVRDDGAPKPLSRTTRLVAYRAVRELLINVAKHAGVSHAKVDAATAGEAMIVTVRDSGKGFDPALLTRPARKGLGLLGVRERMGFVGGSAEIRSAPGRGTKISLTVPIEATEPAEEQPA